MSDAGTILLSIGGEQSEAASARTFDRVNPLTGESASTAAAAGVDDAARSASTAMNRSSASTRGMSARRYLPVWEFRFEGPTTCTCRETLVS